MGLTISNYWFEREIKELNIDLNYKFNVTAIGRVLSLDFASVFYQCREYRELSNVIVNSDKTGGKD